MNLRNVLRAYSLLRQMSDEELAQLEIYRGATDAERALIVETLSDKPQKKSSKKAVGKGGSKSARAASLQQQIKSTTASRTVVGPACGTCGNVEDHPDHDIAHYLSAHEFQLPASSAGKLDAQSAAGGS